MLRLTDAGFHCARGDFYVDPWKPVDRAVITHAHGDHAVAGCGAYMCAREGASVLYARIGMEASVQAVDWGTRVSMGGVHVSFHPAGHIRGSAQIRIESSGDIWVVSGDYKTEPDPTCSAFDVVRCNTFVTESTFGLPIYRWLPQADVFAQMIQWWRSNAADGRASIVYGYSLGKAQRVLAGLQSALAGPVYAHGAIQRMNAVYRDSGVALTDTIHAATLPRGHDFAGSLILAPPSAMGSTWSRRFGDASTALASGWMQVRGARRRRGVDRGFALSDHVDWTSLLGVIEATGAQRVWVTHGHRDPVVRWLRERGLQADNVASRWEGEEGADAGDASGGADIANASHAATP
jgi:putative mRNA 3-end processing factor